LQVEPGLFAKLEYGSDEGWYQTNGKQFEAVVARQGMLLFLIVRSDLKKTQKTLCVLRAFAVQQTNKTTNVPHWSPSAILGKRKNPFVPYPSSKNKQEKPEKYLTEKTIEDVLLQFAKCSALCSTIRNHSF